MNDAAETTKPLRITRTFHAPRALLFKAWSSAEHVKRFFAPSPFTAPEARIEMRVGGPFEVLMRGPDGTEHWARGVVAEVAEPDRLVIDFTVPGPNGRALFRALTELVFSDAPGGSRLDVTQTYAILEPEAEPMVRGAPQGWAQTLDQFAEEIRRMQAAAPVERSVAHGVFTVKRAYDAPAERVWRALTDREAKTKWFGGPPGEWEEIERVMDVRVGGAERAKGRWASGVVTTFDAVYLDVVPCARLVYAYTMYLDDRKISVSLATMELEPEAAGRTTLRVTEQGVFLDGFDDAGSRERGTAFLLDKIGEALG